MKKLIALSLIALSACGEKAPEAAPVTEPQMAAEVTLALKVANGVEASPAATDSVLQANGLSRAGFDSLVYKIAEDSVLSAQYAAGRR